MLRIYIAHPTASVPKVLDSLVLALRHRRYKDALCEVEPQLVPKYNPEAPFKRAVYFVDEMLLKTFSQQSQNPELDLRKCHPTTTEEDMNVEWQSASES